jgi:hypothetical protein
MDEFITEKTKNFDCMDVAPISKQFHLKIYGLKVYVYHSAFNKHLLIYGVVDDIIIQFLNNKFINNAMSSVKNNLPADQDFKSESFERFFAALTLKDYLIMNNILLKEFWHFSHLLTQLLILILEKDLVKMLKLEKQLLLIIIK